MSVFVRPTPAPRPKSKDVRTVSLALAGVFILLAVAQLFTFEKFPGVLASMWLPGGQPVAELLAALLPTLMIFALPFLLAMRLSPAMRVFSMGSGWVVLCAWLVIVLWQNVTSSAIGNAGLLGATIPLPTGWWSVLFVLGLAVLSAWASWGMWPLGKRA